MGSTLCCHLVHVVFSTKNREAFITDALASRLHAYLCGIARNRQCEPIAVGGIEDHVHLLVALHSSIALSDFVRDLKSNSSRWMHEEAGVPAFGWQTGYGAFSVSKSNADVVIAYINNQREHHKARDFRDEYESLLRKHGVEFDERYVFA